MNYSAEQGINSKFIRIRNYILLRKFICIERFQRRLGSVLYFKAGFSYIALSSFSLKIGVSTTLFPTYYYYNISVSSSPTSRSRIPKLASLPSYLFWSIISLSLSLVVRQFYQFIAVRSSVPTSHRGLCLNAIQQLINLITCPILFEFHVRV